MNEKSDSNRKIKKSHERCLVKHFHFEQIDSTNTWAKINSQLWLENGITLISASTQTAGRGRFKRRWESPPDVNIYATFCFWLPSSFLNVGFIPQLLALATAQVLENLDFSPRIKWPNDILLNGKKVGGILCETLCEGEKRGIVCGIGLNVNMPLSLLQQIDRPATSMLAESGKVFQLLSILDSMQSLFTSFIHTFMDQGFDSFFPVLVSKSAHKKGQSIRFHDNQTVIEAKFDSWLPDGSISLCMDSGALKHFNSGEFLF